MTIPDDLPVEFVRIEKKKYKQQCLFLTRKREPISSMVGLLSRTLVLRTGLKGLLTQ